MVIVPSTGTVFLTFLKGNMPSRKNKGKEDPAPQPLQRYIMKDLRIIQDTLNKYNVFFFKEFPTREDNIVFSSNHTS